jgi:hypothetical protein
LCLLSLPKLPTKQLVEHAAGKFVDMGVGQAGTGCVIIRSGAMGAYVATRVKGGQWVDAFWTDEEKIVDVTGRSLTTHRKQQAIDLMYSQAQAIASSVVWPLDCCWKMGMYTRVRRLHERGPRSETHLWLVLE